MLLLALVLITHTVNGSEILQHLQCINLVNNGITHIFTVSRISEP